MSRKIDIERTLAYLRLWLFAIVVFAFSCDDAEDDNQNPGNIDTTDTQDPFDINDINDTYGQIADPKFAAQWGPYNVHDPSVIKEGGYFYSYSTDVAYGATVKPGIQIRRSKDLIEWEFVGWAFPALPSKGVNFIKTNGGEPFNALWAPYVLKVGSTFRLYYSLSSATPRLSVIGLATASSPTGPWIEKDIVVTSLSNSSTQTNAIDPTVLVDKSGNHWMYYGSAWDGIYILKLDPSTGFAISPGAKGVRVAQRGFTGNDINGNIEGAEIIYNATFDKYYLFIAYDWLETKYNVRVGRSDNPEGPFFDIQGNNLNDPTDNIPMILAPYSFGTHLGWQGTAHCAVINDNGQYYMLHQGRPHEDKFYMVMHVRQIFWTANGWPMVSPERFAGIENESVLQSEIAGSWERIVLSYRIVPGYGSEQTSPDIQASVPLTIDMNGTFNGNAANTWTFTYPDLVLNWSDGTVENLIVHRGRDWENKIESTLLITGFDESETAVWGKKLQK